MEPDPMLEDVMRQLGEYGAYQLRQHLLHTLTAFLAGMHMLSLSSVAPTPMHRCFIDEIDGHNKSQLDLSDYIPRNSHGELESCLKFDLVTNQTVSCGGRYYYNNTYYKSSRVIEWNLVCDRRWMRAFLQTIYVFGVLCGAVILGSLADIVGRKPILCISGVLQLVFGVLSAFMSNYVLYGVTLFFYGAFGSGGAYVTGFVLSMELISRSKRTTCGTSINIAFAMGVMLVAYWAFLIPDVKLLQIIYASHSVLLLGHWWLCDESIRFLWGKGRTEKALVIAEKAVKVNGRQFVDRYTEELAQAKQTDQQQLEKKNDSGGLVQMFQYSNLRIRILNMACDWFANSLVYYGLSFSIMGTLHGNPFFISFINGLVEVPGYLAVMILVDKTGRRCLNSLLLFLSGFACTVVAFIPKGMLATMIAMLSKVSVAGSFAIIYIYTAELFPTVARNSAVGFSAMAARTSGMLTTLIFLLDSIGRQLPSVIAGTVAIVAAFFVLFLPETLNTKMPQTFEDGENFGVGDTAFRTLRRLFTESSDQAEEPEPEPVVQQNAPETNIEKSTNLPTHLTDLNQISSN